MSQTFIKRKGVTIAPGVASFSLVALAGIGAHWIISCRVSVGGAGVPGVYVFTDQAGTPTLPDGGGIGIATMDTDGDVLTFPGVVNTVTLYYWPRLEPYPIG